MNQLTRSMCASIDRSVRAEDADDDAADVVEGTRDDGTEAGRETGTGRGLAGGSTAGLVVANAEVVL
jgi:hypothetical protein